MNIAYKVVDRYRNSYMVESTDYSRVYLFDQVVKAKFGTLGIFTFDTKKRAQDFKINTPEMKIIKVEGIGQGQRPKQISLACNSKLQLDDFYAGNYCRGTVPPPPGTVCYPAVKVLE